MSVQNDDGTVERLCGDCLRAGPGREGNRELTVRFGRSLVLALASVLLLFGVASLIAGTPAEFAPTMDAVFGSSESAVSAVLPGVVVVLASEVDQFTMMGALATMSIAVGLSAQGLARKLDREERRLRDPQGVVRAGSVRAIQSLQILFGIEALIGMTFTVFTAALFIHEVTIPPSERNVLLAVFALFSTLWLLTQTVKSLRDGSQGAASLAEIAPIRQPLMNVRGRTGTSDGVIAGFLWWATACTVILVVAMTLIPLDSLPPAVFAMIIGTGACAIMLWSGTSGPHLSCVSRLAGISFSVLPTVLWFLMVLSVVLATTDETRLVKGDAENIILIGVAACALALFAVRGAGIGGWGPMRGLARADVGLPIAGPGKVRAERIESAVSVRGAVIGWAVLILLPLVLAAAGGALVAIDRGDWSGWHTPTVATAAVGCVTLVPAVLCAKGSLFASSTTVARIAVGVAWLWVIAAGLGVGVASRNWVGGGWLFGSGVGLAVALCGGLLVRGVAGRGLYEVAYPFVMSRRRRVAAALRRAGLSEATTGRRARVPVCTNEGCSNASRDEARVGGPDGAGKVE